MKFFYNVVLLLQQRFKKVLDPFPTNILVASDIWIDMLVYIAN